MTSGESTIEFELQDPVTAGRTLLDALVEAARDAKAGGGIFAFASARGVPMLLDESALEALAAHGTLELFVGIDAITNAQALRMLADRERERSGLQVSIVAHDFAALFHPKLCWFEHEDRFELLVGSGNLTPGGLSSNVEAFTALGLRGTSASDARTKISRWIERWQPYFLRPDDPRAIEIAEKNSGAERSLRKPMPAEPEAVDNTQPLRGQPVVLVAEISRNAPRRSQLDVGVDQFRDFFGGEAGKEKRILVQHVNNDGSLDEVEQPRALFPTKSRNYRFEVSAGRGVEYPAEGRPIGVFVRTPDAIFRYCLLRPGDPGHLEADAFLAKRAGPFAGRMRREVTTPVALLEAWPDTPLLAEASAAVG